MRISIRVLLWGSSIGFVGQFFLSHPLAINVLKCVYLHDYLANPIAKANQRKCRVNKKTMDGQSRVSRRLVLAVRALAEGKTVLLSHSKWLWPKLCASREADGMSSWGRDRWFEVLHNGWMWSQHKWHPTMMIGYCECVYFGCLTINELPIQVDRSYFFSSQSVVFINKNKKTSAVRVDDKVFWRVSVILLCKKPIGIMARSLDRFWMQFCILKLITMGKYKFFKFKILNII